MNVSRRITELQASPIRRLSPYAREAISRGIKVHHLNIGQPDIKTPPRVIEAIQRYQEPLIAYGASEGRDDLRRALPAYYKKYGVDVKVEEILITTGGSEALHYTFMTLCDSGDEVIIPEPFYTNVASFAHAGGVKLVPVTSRMEENFALPPLSDFEARITERTRAILICSPNNPTGYIYSRDELLALLALCEKHDIFLVVDEVYREFCYDGETFVSVLTFEEYAQRVVCLDSFSKRYSMCGARVGAFVSRNTAVIANALKLGQARLCPPEIEQIAAHAALATDDSYLVAVRDEYEMRRNTIVEELKKIEGVVVSSPKGAFYLVAELPVDDAEAFAIFMLRDFNLDGETTMVAPCENFYMSEGMGRNQVRIAYVLNTEELKRATACLRAGLKAYQTNVRGR
ncbi:MAG: pyridoxal phosphate-dependent aminotransferase [Sphaerochaeta sp.]|jgi:aspartate aminotransferase|nr:pyridoxal phosphate-dependent aminotransferase [Sphaerochaeta sp.]MDX9914419.1 pyridoxal phosphate-dependent aminotransferase [Sphaerochaeta sp.]